MPLGNMEPLGNPVCKLTVAEPGQLSVAVGNVYETTLEHLLASVLPTTALGQVIEGPSLSNTVTVKEHVDIKFPVSVAFQNTDVVPTGKLEPLAGPDVNDVVTPGQLSVAVTV
jgi:hypothetical protein